jgi:hypothetical protein
MTRAPGVQIRPETGNAARRTSGTGGGEGPETEGRRRGSATGNEIRGTPLDTDVTGFSTYYMRRPLYPRPGELG